MADIKEQAPILTEIGNVQRGEVVLCREYVVFDREKLYDLTVGTTQYVEDLMNVSPEYGSERILIVPSEILADPNNSIAHVSASPNLASFLIEQQEPTEG